MVVTEFAVLRDGRGSLFPMACSIHLAMLHAEHLRLAALRSMACNGRSGMTRVAEAAQVTAHFTGRRRRGEREQDDCQKAR